jgi:hypothetical protein
MFVLNRIAAHFRANDWYSFIMHRMQQEQTALIRAARQAHTACVRLLVEAGADLDAIDQVRSASSVSEYLWFSNFNFAFDNVFVSLLLVTCSLTCC